MSKRKNTSPASNNHRGLLDDVSAIIAPLHALHRQAVEAHAPAVREILRSRSRDARLIERTLDHLLDHACIPQGLTLLNRSAAIIGKLIPKPRPATSTPTARCGIPMNEKPMRPNSCRTTPRRSYETPNSTHPLQPQRSATYQPRATPWDNFPPQRQQAPRGRPIPRVHEH